MLSKRTPRSGGGRQMAKRKIGAARALISTLMLELTRSAHRTFFPDMPFNEAVEAIFILNTMLLAEIHALPLTVAELARKLDIPRATLYRRLAMLEERGFVDRDLRVDLRQMPSSAAHLRRSRDLILDAAKTLLKI